MTTDTTPDLSDLLNRVRSATGPSRELDADVFEALGYEVVRKAWDQIDGYQVRDPSTRKWRDLPRLSASLDAVAALIAEVLPGWWWSCGTCSVSHDSSLGPDVNGPDAHLLEIRLFDEGFHGDRRDGNMCLALLDAIISAVKAVREAGQ